LTTTDLVRNKLAGSRDMSDARNPFAMAAHVRCRYGTAKLPAQSVKASIAAFLDGGTNGEDLLHALYDHVLSEPIPNSMRRILQQSERQVGNSR
jgi:hypothetical protein